MFDIARELRDLRKFLWADRGTDRVQEFLSFTDI